MKYKIEFQHRDENSQRPYDVAQDQELIFEKDENIPVPNVGDSVSYEYGEKMMAFKVESRHFAYLNGWCIVNIVVTDISSNEMAARLKE